MAFQTVRGMRDFLPEKMKKKQFIEDFIRKVFEKYGFEPLQTPIVEDFELLSAKGSGGEAVKNEIYYFKDKSERELGLRYDLTVPLARIAASNPNLPKPFKRYCIGQVYRYDRPQKNRYRMFTQADYDIVGVKGILADFEILDITINIMRKLGLEFKVRINDRRILEELAIKMEIKKEQIKEAFRIIDKLDKIGEKGVEKEFSEKGIDTSILDRISANSFEDTKYALKDSEATKDFEKLLKLCKENDLGEVEFDLSLARGLEYYTGMVIEASLNEGPSVAGGGRYDKLIETYGSQPTPAVGCSFGIDRLFDVMEDDLIVGSNTDIFIVILAEEAQGKALKLASRLRGLNLGVEIDLMQRNIQKNIQYMEKKNIPYLIVLGENEINKGKFIIKELISKKETEFEFDDDKGIFKLVKQNK